MLLDAGKQMTAVLDLDELLDTILRSACELLDATGGSVMLVDQTDLVTACVLGRDVPMGQRTPLGEGVAGHVALRREPVLIDGHADAERFPGLAERAPYVESSMSVPLVHRAELQGVLNVNAPLGRSVHGVRPPRARGVRRAGVRRDHERPSLRGRARPRRGAARAPDA